MIERFIDAIFCSKSIHISIEREIIECTEEQCTCVIPRKFKSLVDFYANLYYMLDNENYKTLLKIIKFCDRDYIDNHRECVKQLWEEHIRRCPYHFNEHEYLNPESQSLIETHLRRQKSKEDLIVCLYLWVRKLTVYLEKLNTYFEKNYIESTVIETSRGMIVLRIESKIANYIFKDELYRAHANPNDSNLKYDLKILHLSKKRYDTQSKIIHKNLFRGTNYGFDISSIGDLKIAFILGEFSLNDYEWIIEDSVDNNKHFYFSGVKNKENYFAKVEELLDQVLKENPHFIVLPELFTPIELQLKIQKRIKSYYREKIHEDQNFNLFLVLTGSFHHEKKGYLYNVSNIVNSSGNLITEIYKMNQYKIEKNPAYEGILRPFKESVGLEKINFDIDGLVILDTPLGRIAILICVDFINDEISTILEDRLVDIVMVMAMTLKPESGKFKRKYQELAEKNWSMVIIANNSESGVKNVVNLPHMNKPYVAVNNIDIKTLKEMKG